jgi:hypothetical protein
MAAASVMIVLNAVDAKMSDCARCFPLWRSRIPTSSARARLTRLFTVPIAHPQIAAVSA